MGRQLETVLVVAVALALVPGCIAAACSVPELLGLQEAGESGRVPYVLGLMGTNPKCAQCLIKCQSAEDKVSCAKDCAVRVPSQNALCHRSRCTVGCLPPHSAPLYREERHTTPAHTPSTPTHIHAKVPVRWAPMRRRRRQ